MIIDNKTEVFTLGYGRMGRDSSFAKMSEHLSNFESELSIQPNLLTIFRICDTGIPAWAKKVIFNRVDRFLRAAIKLKLVILGKMNVTVTFLSFLFQKQLQHDNKNTML